MDVEEDLGQTLREHGFLKEAFGHMREVPKSQVLVNFIWHRYVHLRKRRVLSPLRSLRVRNEVDLVPLACEDEVC